MRKAYAVASGPLTPASLLVAHADELQVSKMKYVQPVVGWVLCAGTSGPTECDAHNALDVILGPPSPTELGCGVQGQEMLAATGIRARWPVREDRLLTRHCAGGLTGRRGKALPDKAVRPAQANNARF
jgi:hypothetical protein